MVRLEKEEIDIKREATEKVRRGPLGRVLRGLARHPGESEPRLPWTRRGVLRVLGPGKTRQGIPGSEKPVSEAFADTTSQKPGWCQ